MYGEGFQGTKSASYEETTFIIADISKNYDSTCIAKTLSNPGTKMLQYLDGMAWGLADDVRRQLVSCRLMTKIQT